MLFIKQYVLALFQNIQFISRFRLNLTHNVLIQYTVQA